MTATFNPSGFTVVLMGDESLTIACGDMIRAGGHNVVAVVTRDDTVHDWAEGQGIAVHSDPRELLSTAVHVDWLLSIANLRLIPDDVLALPAKGAINFHDGPLPRYAGLNTPAWAIINGETIHGVSWHMIEGGLDEGDLLAQRMVDIAPDETAFSLNSKCYAAGMESFASVLAQLESGTLERSVQDLDQRSYFSRDKRPENMGLLDFSQPANVLSALVRGLDFGTYWNPLTTPKLGLDGSFLRVGGLALGDQPAGPAGEVLDIKTNEVTIGTATVPVTLRGMTALNGDAVDLTKSISVGDVIGEPDLAELNVKDEAHWRSVLADFVPLEISLVSAATAAAEMRDRALACPSSISASALATAAGLVVLRSANAEAGMMALPVDAAHPLAASWVPLTLTAQGGDPVTDVQDQVSRQLDRAGDTDGFALDLPLREPAIEDSGTPAVALSFSDQVVAGAAITLCLSDGDARMIHDTTRVSDEGADLLAARFEAAFAAIGKARTCEEVSALPASEMQRQLEASNDTVRDYDRITIHAAFEAQVAATPDAEALVFESETLSYAALNSRANKLAHLLRERGATAGTPIGLYTSRGVDLLVGALGIMKAGGAYVPLDPAYPADRIAHYIADSAAPLIVTQSGLVGQLPSHDAQVVLIDSDPAQQSAPQDNPSPTATADDLAYLIYTSGSTGTPKGVMVSHGNVANFFAGMDDRIDHEAGAVWL
ncbi:MAG: AMP-binding protein, partial [Sulfitobacter sp.]|nr:AMP-binding protein [Sulfitobacter sp.]